MTPMNEGRENWHAISRQWEWAVAAINAWNRVAIAFRSEAGTYKPAAHG